MLQHPLTMGKSNFIKIALICHHMVQDLSSLIKFINCSIVSFKSNFWLEKTSLCPLALTVIRH